MALEHVDEYAQQAAIIRSERAKMLDELSRLPGGQQHSTLSENWLRENAPSYSVVGQRS